MASFYFDGNKLRIYEVPTNSTYAVDSNGYRIYSPIGIGENVVRFDVQRDLWSRFQDYAQENSWTQLAFNRTGGGFRGLDELGNPRYQTNDFQLRTSLGWRIVLANYPHEAIFRGNLFKDGAGELFDYARLTVHGVVPRLEGFDSLQSYFVSTGGSETVWTLPLRDQVVTQLEKISGLVEPTPGGDRFSAKALEQVSAGVWNYSGTVLNGLATQIKADISALALQATLNSGISGLGSAIASLPQATLTENQNTWLQELHRLTGASGGLPLTVFWNQSDPEKRPTQQTAGGIALNFTYQSDRVIVERAL